MPVIDVLAWELVANTKGLIAGVGAAQSKLKALSTGAGATTAAVAALGAAMVVAGAKAAKMAAELDQALAKVSTLLPVTTAELGDLREQIVALSTRVPQTPVQLTEALYQAISSGARDAAEALFLVEAASKAAVAGQSDTETATRAISAAINAYHLDISEATRVSDIFFKTIELGVLEFPDIAAVIGDVAPTAALAGVSLEEVGAALAAMTKNGIGAAEAATSLNRFLLAAITPTDDMAQTAAQLGVDLSAAGLEANGLVGIMRQMEEAAGGDVETLAKLNPEIRAARAAFVIAGKGADDFREILEEMSKSAGSTESAFKKMLNTAQGLAILIGNKLAAAFFEFGEPILRELVIPTLQALNQLLPEIKGETEDFTESLRELNRQLEFFERIGKFIQLIELGLNEFAGQGVMAFSTDEAKEELRQLFVEVFSAPFEGGIQSEDFDALIKRPLEEQLVGARQMLRQLGDLLNDETQNLTSEQRRILQQQFAAVVRFNVDVAQRMAKQAKEAGKDTGKDIVDGMSEGLRERLKTLRESLKEVGRTIAALIGEGTLEGAGQLEAIALEQMLERQRALLDLILENLGRVKLPDGVVADFEAFADAERLDQFRAAVQRIRDEFDDAGERALALVTALQDMQSEEEKISRAFTLDELLETLPPELRAAVAEMLNLADATDDVEDSASKVRELVQNIGTAARATTELAEAFGLVGDGAGQVVSQLDLIAQGVTGVLDGLKEGASFGALLGPIGTAVGGLAGLVSGVFGGGPSQFEIETAQTEQEIASNLRRLSDDIDRLRSAMFDLPGALSSDLLDALERGIGTGEAAFPGAVARRVQDIAAELEAAGISLSELERTAAALGLPVDTLVRILETGEGTVTDYAIALQEAQGILDGLSIDTLDYFDSIAGRLEQAQRRIDVFDISDPIDQIAEFVKVIRQSGDAVNLSGEDFKRLLAGDDSIIQELIRELEEGTGRFEDQASLGDFTRQELIDLLADIESIGDRLGETVVNFFDTLAGRLDIAQRRINRFDIDDPLEQIEEFVRVIEQSGTGLTAAELERLRSGDDTFLNELIDQLEAGTGRFAGDGALGDFTTRELIDILSTIESIGDRLEADVPGGGREGFTESFQTFNRITQAEGVAIIAQLSTSNFFLREIAANTSAFLSLFGTNQVLSVGAPSISGVQPVQEVNRTMNSRISADSAIGQELEALRSGAGFPDVRF